MQAVVEKLLTSSRDTTALSSAFQRLLQQEDVRYHVMTAVRGNLATVMAAGRGVRQISHALLHTFPPIGSSPGHRLVLPSPALLLLFLLLLLLLFFFIPLPGPPPPPAFSHPFFFFFLLRLLILLLFCLLVFLLLFLPFLLLLFFLFLFLLLHFLLPLFLVLLVLSYSGLSDLSLSASAGRHASLPDQCLRPDV